MSMEDQYRRIYSWLPPKDRREVIESRLANDDEAKREWDEWAARLATDPRMAKLEGLWAGTGALDSGEPVDAEEFIIQLWRYARDYHPDGDLSKFRLSSLSGLFDWWAIGDDDDEEDNPDPGPEVWKAAQEAGFIDSNERLVNWPGDDWGAKAE